MILVTFAAVPGSAHWSTGIELSAAATSGDVAIVLDGAAAVTIDCRPGTSDAYCEKLEDGALDGLPDVSNDAGRLRIVEWIDKPGEAGEHIGFTFEVSDATVDLTIVSGNPAKPTGNLSTLQGIGPGTYMWRNPACTENADGAVSCAPSSTSAISHIDVCIAAEAADACAVAEPATVAVRNLGSVPVAVTVGFDGVAIEPSVNALCDGDHLAVVIHDGADPPAELFRGDVCALDGAGLDLGIVDPGASTSFVMSAAPGPALRGADNDAIVSFGVHAEGRVWIGSGGWVTAAHEVGSVTVTGTAPPPSLAEPPPDEPTDEGPPLVVDPPEDTPDPAEPPDDVPPPSDTQPPPPDAPPAVDPPAVDPPGDEPPGDQPPPSSEPPADTDSPNGDEWAVVADVGHVRLAGVDERIEGSGLDSGTGDLTIVLLVSVDDWSTGDERVLVSQWGPQAADRSFRLGVTEQGGIALLVDDGGPVTYDTGPVALPDDTWTWLRVTLDADTPDGGSRLDVFTINGAPLIAPVDIDWGEAAWSVTADRPIARTAAPHRTFLIGGHGLSLATEMRIGFAAMTAGPDTTDEWLVFQSDWREEAEFTGRPPQRPDDLSADFTWTLLGTDIDAVPPAGPIPLALPAGGAAAQALAPRRSPHTTFAGPDRRPSNDRDTGGGRQRTRRS